MSPRQRRTVRWWALGVLAAAGALGALAWVTWEAMTYLAAYFDVPLALVGAAFWLALLVAAASR